MNQAIGLRGRTACSPVRLWPTLWALTGAQSGHPFKKYKYAYYLTNATLVDYVGYPGAMLFQLSCRHILAETEAACPENTYFPGTSAKLCQPSN